MQTYTNLSTITNDDMGIKSGTTVNILAIFTNAENVGDIIFNDTSNNFQSLYQDAVTFINDNSNDIINFTNPT